VSLLCFAGWLLENLRGKRAWEALEREYAAKGQPIDSDAWQKLRGAVVLDDQNVFGTPLIKPLFDYSIQRDASGFSAVRWNQPEGFLRIRAVRLPVLLVDEDRFIGDRLDLAQWQRVFHRAGGFAMGEAEANPAREVLVALHRWDAELAELELATRRPVALLPLNEELPAATLQPPMAFRRVSEILLLRCTARLAVGEEAGALRDFEFNERLGRALLNNNGDFCQMAGENILTRGGRMAWEGLYRHQWNREQIARIESVLESRPTRESWLSSLAYNQMDRCRDLRSRPARLPDEVRDSSVKFVADLAGQIQSSASHSLDLFQGRETLPAYTSSLCEMALNDLWRAGDLAFTAAIAWTPGWRYQNLVSSIREVEPQCRMLESWVRQKVLFETVAQDPVANPRKWWSLYRSPNFLPARPPLDALHHVADAECLTRMTRIACAVERYRMDFGTLPANLGQLVPGYVTEVPRDTFTDQDFIYVPLDNGHFLLDSPYRPGLHDQRLGRWPAQSESEPDHGVITPKVG
jgi:hypothetical protein